MVALGSPGAAKGLAPTRVPEAPLAPLRRRPQRPPAPSGAYDEGQPAAGPLWITVADRAITPAFWAVTRVHPDDPGAGDTQASPVVTLQNRV
jgi:hypothetical protein